MKTKYSDTDKRFDKEFPGEFITVEDNMARIETRGVTCNAIKSFLHQELDRARKEEIKNKIFAVDCLMLEIVHLPLEKADMNRLCKLADKLTGEDRSVIYKADSKNK